MKLNELIDKYEKILEDIEDYIEFVKDSYPDRLISNLNGNKKAVKSFLKDLKELE